MLWKCADGGYHEGQDCWVEFRQLLRHKAQQKNDVRLVRLASVEEVQAATNKMGWDIPAETVAEVLDALVQLTPEHKKEWDELHNAKKKD